MTFELPKNFGAAAGRDRKFFFFLFVLNGLTFSSMFLCAEANI